jgi:hypothetical protein
MIGKLMLAGALAFVPIPTQCEGGDSDQPPTVSCLIQDRTATPEAGLCHAYGASGWVQASAICRNWLNVAESYDTEAIFFGGGGSAYEGGLWWRVPCSWFYPYLVEHYAWSWG